MLSLRSLKSTLSLRTLEDPKENPITKDPKENSITEDFKENPITDAPKELQDPQWISRCKKLFLAFWCCYVTEWVMG